MKILRCVVNKMLQLDDSGEYQAAISVLSSRYAKLQEWRLDEFKQGSKEVLNACNSVVEAAIEADYFYDNDNFKTLSVVSKLVSKTLKVSQKYIAGLLLKNPEKIAVAYNALHSVIHNIEKKDSFTKRGSDGEENS